MTKPVILTGLRANNDLHIGNYFGALLPIVDMAKNKAGEYQINLFVPDLHSFTTPIDHGKFQAAIIQNLRVFAAAGLPLDDENVFLYRQSYIPAHTELAWILGCFTGFGELNRMTEFKDKSSRLGIEHIGAGQFYYPPLMAADILLYDAEYVPVGDDQRQNLEYTRNIAERLNKRFGDVLVVPKPVKQQDEFFGKDQGLRIKDLADPAKKMSKSTESNKGVIFLNDNPKAAQEKITSATTDSLSKVAYDPENQPGVSNLLQIYSLLSNSDMNQTLEFFKGESQYGNFKLQVAAKVAEFLEDFQAKLAKVDEKALISKLETSEAAMNKVANATLERVQKAVGLR